MSNGKFNRFLMTEQQKTLINYLIEEISEFYTDNPKLDSGFFDSLERQWLEKNYLSEKQIAALQKIYDKMDFLDNY